MFVCMSVRYGFMTEIDVLMHSLCTSLARAAHDAGDNAGWNESRDMEDG